ncbi:MAG TPA: lysylphosphatidylglycerol synthase transmembrane domain-containing protein [Bacteroidia bacterium]|nr:lysylphosphatidylglycerol synthase transmembrane domain-containing protein [Bacteroidia bacterium]
MKSNLRQAFQFALFFGLGIGLTYWQFHSLSPEQQDQFFIALRKANYGWMVVAILIGALAHLSRAMRWQLLLSPLGRKAGLGSRWYAVMIGYLANYGIPRSGEVIRCTTLATNEDVPFSESFGTVIVERLVDTLCLALVFLIVLAIEFTQLSDLWTHFIWGPASLKFGKMMQNKTLVIALGVFILLFIAAFIFLRRRIAEKIKGKLGNFIKGFVGGLVAIKKVPKPGLFIFHSLFIWAGYLFSLYACFFCFPETAGLSVNTALVLLLFGTFGVIFTPGGIGAYQLIVTAILIHLFASAEPAAAPFSWLSWGAQVMTVVLFTGITFAAKNSLNRLSQ